MAAVTAMGRWLRLDEASWSRYARLGTIWNAVVITLGAYALLAFDRFGIQGVVAPRAPVRMLLTGFYGWVGLGLGIWLMARVKLGTSASPATVIRLVGRAHIPLLLVALTIQVLAVSFLVFGPALWLALFSIGVWIPAMLLAATRKALTLDARTAALMAIGPYLLWLLIVGRYLELQVGHLL